MLFQKLYFWLFVNLLNIKILENPWGIPLWFDTNHTRWIRHTHLRKGRDHTTNNLHRNLNILKVEDIHKTTIGKSGAIFHYFYRCMNSYKCSRPHTYFEDSCLWFNSSSRFNAHFWKSLLTMVTAHCFSSCCRILRLLWTCICLGLKMGEKM